MFTVEGEGTVIDYVDGFSEIFKNYADVNTVVELTIGSTVAYVNGTAHTLDAAPINRNDRTMLPVRFLANSFGVSDDGIKWDGATRTVTIKTSSVDISITIGASYMTVNGASSLNTKTAYTVSVNPSDATAEVSWSVDNENIAAIDETGTLTPKNNGTVTIKAKMQQIDWGLKFPFRSIAGKTPKSRAPITEVQKTELCPYGCARLRMTEMPVLGK